VSGPTDRQMITPLIQSTREITEGLLAEVASDPGKAVDLGDLLASTFLTGFDDGIRLAIEDPELVRLLRGVLDREVFPNSDAGNATVVTMLERYRAIRRAG
jgi:hypothetical protein